ncbi:MAG: hypothetical protein BMS9Abin15_0439 [Gammaproteobacteria bacterium]|nr:MAG: hypothetical protein BMS9Abin15_0439 [Gammaproteobacteria bacterium]
MIKVAIVVLADTETHESLGRVVNAMEAVKEFSEAGDEVQMIFDGAGSKWIGALSNPEHNYHGLYKSIKDKISGVCDYCANAFSVSDKVQADGIPMMGEYEGHPSFRKLITEGYQVITF